LRTAAHVNVHVNRSWENEETGAVDLLIRGHPCPGMGDHTIPYGDIHNAPAREEDIAQHHGAG